MRERETISVFLTCARRPVRVSQAMDCASLASLAKHVRLLRTSRPRRPDAMQVNILEAKNQLSKLVKAAASGTEVIIASNGKPVAKLVPIEQPRKLRGWRKLKIDSAKMDAAFAPELDEEIARSLERR